MFNTRLFTIAAIGLLLCGISTLAYGAKYATQYKDREGNTRSLHAECRFSRISSTVAEGDTPREAGMNLTLLFDANEKVLSVRRGITEISYKQANGKALVELLGATAKEMPDKAKTEDKLAPTTATYLRKASGEITGVKDADDELGAYLSRNLGAVGLLPYVALALPFGHGLAFPEAGMKDGQSWSQTAVVAMTDDFPVLVTAIFTVDGKQKVDNRELLQITCVMTGKRDPEARDWKDEQKKTVSGTYAGTVDGKVIYLFDAEAGAVQRVTADLTSVQEMKQPGKTTKLTDHLQTTLEQAPVATK